jgi:putative transposase
VSRSTLAYANEHRPAEVYEAYFYFMYDRLSRLMSPKARRKFGLKNPFRIVDSTTIQLCFTAFDWAHYRTNKGAMKIHLGLDGETHLPGWATITIGKTHDVKALRKLDDSTFLPKGSIVALDRGYIDYDRFRKWCENGISFVTRAKDNMAFRVLENREVPALVGRPRTAELAGNPRSRVLSDQIVQLSGKQSFEKCPDNLRLVRYWDEDGKREFTFLTNNMKLAPVTIAKLYKERWNIESFFKCLKQNTIVKSFLGTSFNAVKTQIWISLISVMLMKYLKCLCAEGWTLSNFLDMVRLYLMKRVNLLALIERLSEPERPPPSRGGWSTASSDRTGMGPVIWDSTSDIATR